MRLVAFLLIALAMAGCWRQPRYQMMVFQDTVVRMDTQTGEIVAYQYTNAGLLKLSATGPAP